MEYGEKENHWKHNSQQASSIFKTQKQCEKELSRHRPILLQEKEK